MAVYSTAYVGQVERGEKNMTLDSLMKFATALEVSLPQLLNGLGSNNDKSDTFLRFSEFFSMKSRAAAFPFFRTNNLRRGGSKEGNRGFFSLVRLCALSSYKERACPRGISGKRRNVIVIKKY